MPSARSRRLKLWCASIWRRKTISTTPWWRGEDYLVLPRRWDIGNIFKFMIFIGPISSIFDYATYAMMLFIFDGWSNAPLFQTGWFVESLLTQTLIIHIIRTAKIPFIESRASGPLIATTIVI